MTGRGLVAASLRMIGALAPGESPSAQEAMDGLASFNRMIDSWSTEKLLIYGIVREQFNLVAGTAAYTMGPSGAFNTSRPQWIDQALIRDESVSPAVEYPVQILSLDEYAKISVKGVASTYPDSLYVDGGYPLLTLTLYPTPSAAHKLVLFSAKPLTSISDLDAVLALPPGYERALVFNGALELAPEYARQVDPVVLANAIESKAGIKRANQKTDYLRVDSALLERSNSFNILTGETR